MRARGWEGWLLAEVSDAHSGRRLKAEKPAPLNVASLRGLTLETAAGQTQSLTSPVLTAAAAGRNPKAKDQRAHLEVLCARGGEVTIK